MTDRSLILSLANRLYIVSRLLTARVDGEGWDSERVRWVVAELERQVREGIPMSEDSK
jgi:hypothetical protein